MSFSDETAITGASSQIIVEGVAHVTQQERTFIGIESANLYHDPQSLDGAICVTRKLPRRRTHTAISGTSDIVPSIGCTGNSLNSQKIEVAQLSSPSPKRKNTGGSRISANSAWSTRSSSYHGFEENDINDLPKVMTLEKILLNQ